MLSKSRSKFMLAWPRPRMHQIFLGLNCEVCLPFLDSIIAPATAHEVTAIHPLALYVTHATSRP